MVVVVTTYRGGVSPDEVARVGIVCSDAVVAVPVELRLVMVGSSDWVLLGNGMHWSDVSLT